MFANWRWFNTHGTKMAIPTIGSTAARIVIISLQFHSYVTTSLNVNPIIFGSLRKNRSNQFTISFQHNPWMPGWLTLQTRRVDVNITLAITYSKRNPYLFGFDSLNWIPSSQLTRLNWASQIRDRNWDILHYVNIFHKADTTASIYDFYIKCRANNTDSIHPE